MEDNLKPCPFCGGEKLQINRPQDTEHGLASIFCIDCRGSIRTKLLMDLEILWNRRADLCTEGDVCSDIAKELAGKDWHQLSTRKCKMVSRLEKLGYLEASESPNGFVGRVIK